MTIYEKMKTELEARTDRSAWNKGVTAYALELVEGLEEAANYNGRNPNSRETWLDCQARALFQACNRVTRLYRTIAKEG